MHQRKLGVLIMTESMYKLLSLVTNQKFYDIFNYTF